ncbi:FKBP-type peptidyl-prolyl cis-trans isomerase N-terminal domain-containing protein [Serratia marcescens]
MTCSSVNVRSRLCRLAVVLPLLWGTGSVQADEGIPALLQFAEQYRSEQPPATAPTAGGSKTMDTPAPKKKTPPALGTTGAVSGDREGGSPSLRRTLKQRDAQLNKQQTALREQEKQLATLRQALKTAEVKLQKIGKPAPVVPASPGKPADFVPLQQLVGQLRDAISGTPDAKRGGELITQARRQVERSRGDLAHSQAQVHALKVQLGDLKKQLQNGTQSISREQQSRQTVQAKLETLQAQLDDKVKNLSTLGAQLREAQEQRSAMATQLASLQKTQASQQQQAGKALAEVQAEREKVLTNLTSQRDALEAERKAQLAVITQKESALSALQADKQALQKRADGLQQQVSAADARLVKQEQELMLLSDDAEQLRERAKWLVKPENLGQAEGRQAYAAGSALGRDIIEMLDERKNWGVKADRQTVLAGVIDAFSGQYQLTTDVLTKALAESEFVVNKAREKAIAGQLKKGEAFVADFKKQKGVKQSASGFWYRVDYAGDESIAEDSIVEVVVKESLTDGTVIQDMDVGGNVLSQSLDAYPPLFREAIGHLRNHGTLTMVVPPALAYGEDGYPPKVPPNATMVYELRVDGVKAQARQ